MRTVLLWTTFFPVGDWLAVLELLGLCTMTGQLRNWTVDSGATVGVGASRQKKKEGGGEKLAQSMWCWIRGSASSMLSLIALYKERQTERGKGGCRWVDTDGFCAPPFPCCWLRRPGGHNAPAAVSIPSTWVLALSTFSKLLSGLLREVAGSGSGLEIHRLGLEHLLVPGVRGALGECACVHTAHKHDLSDMHTHDLSETQEPTEEAPLTD